MTNVSNVYLGFSRAWAGRGVPPGSGPGPKPPVPGRPPGPWASGRAAEPSGPRPNSPAGDPNSPDRDPKSPDRDPNSPDRDPKSPRANSPEGNSPVPGPKPPDRDPNSPRPPNSDAAGGRSSAMRAIGPVAASASRRSA